VIAGFSLFALVIAAFVLLTILMGVRQVPQGWNYTVERFGKYRKTLTPGLGFIMPYVDSVGRKLNVMEQVIDVPSQEIITKDNASVKVDGVAFYQVRDPRRASYEVSNLQEALLNLVMTNIRTVMGSMDNSSIAEKYVRAFTALAQAPNQRTFIVPMELASLAGTLSGIAAVAGSAQSEARAEEAARVRRAIVPDGPARAAGPA
jgi:regulator of protease activity HflC (stomatin/prohibitin superfamily)